MTQPSTTDQLLILADRAERGPLTAAEAVRLREGISALHTELQQWRDTYGEHALPRTLARLHGAEAAIERVRKLVDRWENALAPDRSYARAVRAALDEHQEQPATGEHRGGNAEDCPACTGANPAYPFICPGPTDA